MPRARRGQKPVVIAACVLVALLAGPTSACLGQGTETARRRSRSTKRTPRKAARRTHRDPGRRLRPNGSSKSTRRRDPPGFYMGRRIADVMSWEGAEWLFRETRIEEEQPEAMLDALKIPAGATVADVGAGAGYHSIRLARRVGPKGTVLATDIQPEMLRMLRENARVARRHEHQADSRDTV